MENKIQKAIIENYLKENNEKFRYRTPYDVNSQGEVERFLKTIRQLE